MSIVPRPRSITEQFDAAFQIVRAHFGPLSLLAAIAALPLMAAGLASALVMPGAEALARGQMPSAGGITLVSLLSLVAWLWFTVGTSAIIVATVRAYRGEAVDAGDCLRTARSRFGSVFGANVVKFAVIAGVVLLAALATAIAGAITSFLAFFTLVGGAVGAVYMMLRTYPITAIATMEPIGGGEAFARTGPLTRGAKGRIAGLQLIGFLVAMGVFAIFYAAGALVGSAVGSVAGGVSPALSAAIGSLWYLGYAFLAVVQAVFYVDLRVRAEGYDIELMAQQLAGTPAPARATRHA